MVSCNMFNCFINTLSNSIRNDLSLLPDFQSNNFIRNIGTDNYLYLIFGIKIILILKINYLTIETS